MNRMEIRYMALALGMLTLVCTVSCDGDDNSGGDETGGDSDTDADTDTDTDSDTDSTDGFSGELHGEIIGARIAIRTLKKKDMELGVTVSWTALNGNVDHVEVQEIRVFLQGEANPFFITPGKEEIKTGIEFDGVVLQDYPQEIGYSYLSESMNEFDQYCKVNFQVEVDATFGNGQPLVLGPWGGSTETVTCLEE